MSKRKCNFVVGIDIDANYSNYRKQMGKLMTRNEAAAFLGVDAQTITNWVHKGLLGGYNDKESRRFYVNAEDVHKYSEKYKLLAVSESTLDDAIQKLQKESKKANAKLVALAQKTFDFSKFNKRDDVVKALFYLMDKFQWHAASRRILASFILGEKIRDIAHECQLSETRVRSIIVRGLSIILCRLEDIGKLMQENESLKKELSLQGEEIEKTKNELIARVAKIEEKDVHFKISGIYKKKLSDCPPLCTCSKLFTQCWYRDYWRLSSFGQVCSAKKPKYGQKMYYGDRKLLKLSESKSGYAVCYS